MKATWALVTNKRMILAWSEKGTGFGELSFWRDAETDSWSCASEYMAINKDKSFLVKALTAWVDSVEIKE